MAKSYVAMGYEMCPVCGTFHNESILLNTHLQDVFPDKPFCTGATFCSEHEAMREEYLALVEVSNKDSGFSFKDAEVTGNYAHIRRSAVPHLFNIPIAPETPFVFVELGVIDKLKSLCE